MSVYKKIIVSQGANYQVSVQLQDANGCIMNTTDWDSRIQVRRNFNSTTPLKSFNKTNGKILVEGGIHTLYLLPSDTNDLTIKGAELPCVYDWEIVEPTGIVYQIYYGDWVFRKNITI